MKKINFLKEIKSSKDLSLYFHIPFCQSRCYYCDFCSSVLNEDLADKYFHALYKEIDLYGSFIKDKEIESIFIGGGTPSCVKKEYIEEILKRVKVYNDLKNTGEITIEINPNSLTKDKLLSYKAAGVNRFSLGAQSFNDRLLSLIGRIHKKDDILKAVDLFERCKIKNFSLDLMSALPYQKLSDVKECIDYIKDIKPKHISYYSLILEKGTPLYNNRDKYLFPDETEDRNMYHYIVNELEHLGLKQYEISNFALPGYESRHNLRYWKLKNYLGLGLSAYSNIENFRFNNSYSFKTYIENLNNQESAVDEVEALSKEDRINEYIIMTLRINDGLNIKDFNKAFNLDFESEYKKEIEKNINAKLIESSKEGIRLTKKGLDLSNQVELDFFRIR
ncbi:radical SAM family heme chaperone HemW [Peptoniphilus catoniae]|uniref:radical SAM family heme chaperone HemW n=1 Tax=Peptoniphilus catoniae TaxID=1660341 RepID=UPI0010FE9BCA|nr:radical SAM family heme chaperone HemW [Peptoniphilus catoniae]